MFRHNIGPDGRVRGMLNHLGQQANGDEILVSEFLQPLTAGGTVTNMPPDEIPLPISIGGNFMRFLNNNRLPNGRINPIPTLTPEEFRLLARPYNEWAPAPFNNNGNPHDSGINMFMMSLSGMADMLDFDMILSGRFEGLSFIDHEMHFNKMRAWGGLVPLSDRRWGGKGLDQSSTDDPPVSFLKAISHLEKTNVFMYFNLPEVQDKMRRTYNRAYDHLDQFDRILSAHYALQPPHLRPHEFADRGKAAQLWTEFFFSHIQFMTARAHTWYTNHINKLHDNIIDEFKNAPPVIPQMTPKQTITVQQLEIVVSHRAKADISLLISLAGFKNNLPHWRHLSSPARVVNQNNPYAPPGSLPIPGTFPRDIIQRENVYSTRQTYLINERLAATGAANHLTSNPEPAIRLAWQTRDQTRDELRGGPPTTIVEELWITRLRTILDLTPHPSSRQPPFTEWGFIAYRLDYTSHTAEQWFIFQELFKSDTTTWGAGVFGHEHIKSKCNVKWLDGRDYNIPENDIAAARRHFKSLHNAKSPILNGLLTPDAFLVADKTSVNSFLCPPTLPGQDYIDACDLTPFITIAQSQPFDPAVAAQDKESPGYVGQLYVAGNVLFDDVWPALFMRLYDLKAMWPIAAVHPGGLYRGPYAEYEKMLWSEFNHVRVGMMFEAATARG